MRRKGDVRKTARRKKGLGRWDKESTKLSSAAGLLVVCAAVAWLGWRSGKERPPGLVHSFQLQGKLPHDRESFTQGLLYYNDSLVETVGMFGQSRIMRLDPTTAEILHDRWFPESDFAEGVTSDGNGKFVALTWRSGKGYIVDATDFAFVKEWSYEGDGWGIALNRARKELYLSDGSATIRVLDPVTLNERRRFGVTDAGRPIHLLNELEFIDNELWSNVFGTFLVARVNPRSGVVNQWIDFEELLSVDEMAFGGIDVMNGIAYDEKNRRIYVTGKYWPYIFEVQPTDEIIADNVAKRRPPFLDKDLLRRYQRALSLPIDTFNVR